MGLKSGKIKGYLSGRVIFVADEEGKKNLGRVRVIDAPYSYLYCGDKGEDLLHFLGACLRLQNLRKWLFSSSYGQVDDYSQ